MAIEQARREATEFFWISPSRFVYPTSRRAIPEPAQLRENLWEIHLRGESAPSLYDSAIESIDGDPSARFHQAGYTRTSAWLPPAPSCNFLPGGGLAWPCATDSPAQGASTTAWMTGAIGRFCGGQAPAASPISRSSWARATSSLSPRASCAMRLRKTALHPRSFPTPPISISFKVGQAGSACSFYDQIVGYYGAIADWFDLDLMAEVAASRPQYSFVLDRPRSSLWMASAS